MADRITYFDLFIILIKKETNFTKNLKLNKIFLNFLYSEINTVIQIGNVY